MNTSEKRDLKQLKQFAKWLDRLVITENLSAQDRSKAVVYANMIKAEIKSFEHYFKGNTWR